MAIHQRMVMMILAFMCQWACTQGLSFQNCDNEKIAELNLDHTNLNKTFTCVEISNNAAVRWQLKTTQGRRVPAGACLPFDGTVKSCDTRSSNLYGTVFPERTSNSESTMTIHIRPLWKALENATLLCQVADGRTTTCPLDLIRPASGTCNAELVTESSRQWSVRVRCTITRGYSTRGRYSCLFFQESPRKREVAVIRMTYTDRLPKGIAVCDHEFRVSKTDTGRHRYSIQLTPGRRNVTVLGNITIAQAAPTTSTSPGAERDAPSYLALAVGEGVALGVILIVVVIFVIWLWRRQWKLPCADTDNHADATAQQETEPDDYLEPVSRPVDISGPYGSLQMADVGQSSEYSVISAPGHPATA